MLQEPPLMTEDMHEERMQAVEAIGDSFVSSNFFLFDENARALGNKENEIQLCIQKEC